MGPSACDAAPPCFASQHPCHGASHEEGSDEGGGHEEGWDEEGGCHEVDEGDEGEEGERHRQGHGSQGACLLWEEEQDAVRPHQGQADQEQAWEGVSKKQSAAAKKKWVE